MAAPGYTKKSGSPAMVARIKREQLPFRDKLQTAKAQTAARKLQEANTTGNRARANAARGEYLRAAYAARKAAR